MSSPRVLVVEDEFLIRLLLVEALTSAGCEVQEASSADEAAPLVNHEGAFDLLLTDVNMPGRLDGVALAARARRVDPGLPVVFVTGRPDRLPGREGPREAVLSKPFGPSEMLDVIGRVLDASGRGHLNGAGGFC